MKKTVTMPVHNRPECLAQVLASLEANDTDGYTLVIGLEPTSEACRALCEGVDFMDTQIFYNPRTLGITDNTYNVLCAAFDAGSELNLLLEEDVVISPDALDLADWYSRQDLDGIMHLLLLQMYGAPVDRNTILLHDHYLSWGSVFTRAQWEQHLKPTWSMPAGDPPMSWDLRVNRYQQASGVRAMMPLMSRARNVGVEGVNSRENPATVALSKLVINEERTHGAYALAAHVDVYVHLTTDRRRAPDLLAVLVDYARSCRGHDDLHDTRVLRRPDAPGDLVLIQRWAFLGSFFRTVKTLREGTVPSLASLPALLTEPFALAFFVSPVALNRYDAVVI